MFIRVDLGLIYLFSKVIKEWAFGHAADILMILCFFRFLGEINCVNLQDI
jgi:hypothetical protein